MGWMSMSTRARGEGVKGMGVYDCWVQGLGLGIYGCFTYLLICWQEVGLKTRFCS